MERQLENIDKQIVTLEYLNIHNLLWFYYANNVFTKFNFKVNQEVYTICDILSPENQINLYPLLVDLVKKRKVKLKDLMDYYMHSKEGS